MTINEYDKVKDYDYLQYCNYLQNKYGISSYDYMTINWKKNPKITRTKEGLFAHHKYEDHAIMLSNPTYAMKNPYEWQLRQNIIYCDFLEHLFLHILICENPSEEKNENENVGIGGVINFIVPELNDVYSGWTSNEQWRKNCHNIIINDKNVYLTLIKRFITIYDNPIITNYLLRSYNEQFGKWSNQNNKKIYDEIKAL